MNSEVVHGGDALDRFHPVVQTWFRERFGQPTAPQIAGWPAIAAGRDTLIAAPTGSGKTLAAFLACFDGLIQRGLREPLPDATQILYVSPLKALSNDVHRNLEKPLAEIALVAAREGLRLPDIRAAVRTGDTPASERERMAKRPPHILVTTPESLFILLTSSRGRTGLSGVRTVIVDEIHAMADDKRGAHLALSLERLDRLVRDSGAAAPTRVGLSATQRPIERIGRLLVGNHRPLPVILDGGHARHLDLAIELTDDELGAVASHEQMGRVYDRITELVGEHRTTLVFVNTRRMVEQVARHLELRLGEEQVVAHHGSMSRAMRLAAEEKLKHGRVRCAVATASLELGIDVGTVDLVVQIGSPRSIATLLQRIGRSGHSLGATPRGRLFAVTRDQLIECAALVRAIKAGNLDAIELPAGPLDILSQQIVALTACEEIGEEELWELVRGAAHYGDLDRARFEQVLTMLSEGVSSRRGRLQAHVHRDLVNRRLRGRRGARLAAITSGGAIPDNANYAVVTWPEEIKVGELDEDFAIESSAGDIFQLGNTAWKIRRVEAGRVLVEDAHGQPPTLPFWLGEAPARTRELSDEVGGLRREIETQLRAGDALPAIADWLAAAAAMPRGGAEQIVAYLHASHAVLGSLPRREVLVAERFFDEAGGMQLVIHAPLGGRINRAWGLALRKRFCRSFNFELQAAATDDGLVISLGQPHSFPLIDVFRFLSSATVEEVLIQALLDAPMFEVRWRWNATRSLAVLRRNAGKKVPPYLVRMRSADLLSVVFPMAQACLENVPGDREIPDHPLVFETVRDCLTEAMDVEGLRALIGSIERGEIELRACDTVEPSPLCHELINANPYAYLDDAPLEERRTRAVTLRRGLPSELAETVGALDPAAIAAAADEAAPTVRDRDELHDALLSLHLVPERRGRGLAAPAVGWMKELVADRRATTLRWSRGDRCWVGWVAAERLPTVLSVLPDAVCDPVLPTLAGLAPAPGRETALVRIVGAQLDHGGPRTASGIADELGLGTIDVDEALAALEADGAVLRGRFGGVDAEARSGEADDRDAAGASVVEWCNRRILARIHRLTLQRLRREIEPVDAAALMRFLLRWQRVTRGHQQIGHDGLARVIEQLQGFESAAGAWEREILPARLHGYEAGWLDTLCLGGEVAWCRLSPRKAQPATEAAANENRDDDDRAGNGHDPADGDSQDPGDGDGRADGDGDGDSRDVDDGRDVDAPDDLRDGHSYSGNGYGGNGYGGNGYGGNGHGGNGYGGNGYGGNGYSGNGYSGNGYSGNGYSGNGGAQSSNGQSGSGAPVDVRTRNAPTKAAPLAILLRRDLAWLRAPAARDDDAEAAMAGLGASAAAVHAHLASRGASFLAEIVSATRLEPADVEDGLWELVAAGLATADGFASLRLLVDRQRGPTGAVPRSHFDRGGDDAAVRSRRWQDALRKARGRDTRRPAHAVRALPTAAGRWSLLGATSAEEMNVEASARQLLQRYGVIFRDLLLRESTLPPWRDMLVALRRLEARGEIRGGRFVNGFVGEQFALAEAVEGLRAARHPGPAAELVRVAATDPLNLVGITSSGPRVPAVVGNAVLYRDGVPIASLEAGEVVLRRPLELGERIDSDLAYHAPPRAPLPPPQVALPL